METQRVKNDESLLAAGPFPTTHWTSVRAAGELGSPQAAAALERLCARYWFPVYAYVRRAGHDTHTAQDLTQEFFRRLIARNFVAQAVPELGRFRSFLLVALKRFLVNEWQRHRAQKRGGGHELLSFDAERAEARYLLEPVDHLTPERIFERRWALAVLDLVMEKLRLEQSAAGHDALFAQLKPFLYRERIPGSQTDIGRRFQMTESAVKSKVHRLRQRYRELLHEEVALTVASAVEVEDELRHLLKVLRD